MMVDQILQSIAAYVNALLFYLSSFFSVYLKNILDYLTGLTVGVANFFATTLQSVFTYVQQFTVGILDRIANILAGISGRIESALQVLVSTISNTLVFVGYRLDQMATTILSQVGSLVDRVVTVFHAVVDRVAAGVQGVLERAVVVSETILARLGAAVSSVLDALRGWADTIMDAVRRSVVTVVETLAAWVATVAQRVTDLVTAAVTTLAGWVSEMAQRVSGLVTAAVSVLVGWVTDMAQRVSGLVTAALDAITRVVDRVAPYVTSLVSAASDQVARAVTLLASGITRVIDAVLSTVTEAISRLSGLITAAWSTLVEGPTALVSAINERLQSVAGAFAAAAATVVDAVVGIAGDQLDGIREFLGNLQSSMSSLTDTDGAETVIAAIERAMAPGTLTLHTRADFHAFWSTLQPKGVLTRFLFAALFGVGILWALYADIAAANARVIAQEFALTFPSQLLPPADLATARLKGDRTEAHAVVDLRKQGYQVEDAQQLLRNAERPPATADLLSLWLRGLIPEPATDAGLRELGYAPRWIGPLKDAAQILPPVADLVQMAVREAFSPDIAARFGQYEDFPADVVEPAAQQGLSREWVTRYWAAHWSLPSATMGFEMLHRRIIDEKDLHLLLRALDVMPYWRDRLVQLSYNPLTRVDIRRMHAVKVLTDAQVDDAYRDLGYSPEHARQLTAFTLALNRGKTSIDDDDLARLTRAQILGFYDDGLIDSARAHELLHLQGHTAEAAALLVSTVDLDDQRRERKLVQDTIVDQVAAGQLTLREAESQLNAVGLTTREVTRTMARLTRQQVTARKHPTVEQVLKLWTEGLVAEPLVRQTLTTLGYAPVWIDAWVALGEIQAKGEV